MTPDFWNLLGKSRIKAETAREGAVSGFSEKFLFGSVLLCSKYSLHPSGGRRLTVFSNCKKRGFRASSERTLKCVFKN